MKKRVLFFLMAIVLASSAWNAWGLGFTGSVFELGASARGLGLGGAFTALVDDETAVIHNPAVLGQLKSVGISSLYVNQFGGITYGSVSLAMPWVGVNMAIVDSGLIPSTQGAFRYRSQSLAISGGVPVGPVSLGLRWRFLNVSSPAQGNGWTIDPAILIDAGSVRVGALFESAFSAAMGYESGVEEDFEPSLRLGIAAKLSPSPDVWWNAAFEASGLFAAQTQFAAGLEAWIGGLGARVGYDGVGATVGLTIRFNGLQFDWAYAMRSDLGGSHRASLTYRF
ncbi:hypothetical protein KKG90_03235 [Candidatus Bipolaricaulota bacterium]|nr:hypothetical protein [Candidatus Bipolaricaulota bacterium]